MKTIDNFILKKFQKLADFLQITFGITCFRLSRYLIIAWAIVDVFLDCIHAADTGIEIKISPFLIVPLLLSTSYIFFINQVEKQYEATPDCKNILEEKFFSTRLILAFGFVISIFAIFFNSALIWLKGFAEHYVSKFAFMAIVLWLLGLYFASCTPLPPQKSRLKKFIEKLTATLSGVKTQLA